MDHFIEAWSSFFRLFRESFKSLMESNLKVFCDVCYFFVGSKKTINHLSSVEHQYNLKNIYNEKLVCEKCH